MEHIKEIRQGVDVGYGVTACLHPANGEGRVGKNGIDKTFTIEQVIGLALKMVEKPNIIIKAGTNAKWYLKRFAIEDLPSEIEKQNWRDTSKCTMYIIDNSHF